MTRTMTIRRRRQSFGGITRRRAFKMQQQIERSATGHYDAVMAGDMDKDVLDPINRRRFADWWGLETLFGPGPDAEEALENEGAYMSPTIRRALEAQLEEGS